MLLKQRAAINEEMFARATSTCARVSTTRCPNYGGICCQCPSVGQQNTRIPIELPMVSVRMRRCVRHLGAQILAELNVASRDALERDG